ANSIVWMIPNERVGAWMPLGRVCSIGFGKQGNSWNAGQRGSQGDTSPCTGVQGQSPASGRRWPPVQRLQAASAAAQRQPISPAGLAYSIQGLKSREKSADFSGHPHPLTARSYRLLARQRPLLQLIIDDIFQRNNQPHCHK